MCDGERASPAAVSRRAAGSQETAESADTAGPRETAAEPAGAAGPPGAVGSPRATADRGSAVPWRAMTWASVALAALVAKAEAGSVIQEVMPTGQTGRRPVRPGPAVHTGQPGRHPECLDPRESSIQRPVDLAEHIASFDIVFIASCVGLGLAFRPAPARDGEPRPSGLPRLVRGWRLLAWWPLYALALANLIQDIIAVTAFCVWIRQHNTVPAGLAWALEQAVIAKWILVIVLAAWLIYRVFTSDASPRRARQITVALKKQRFSLVIVALLAVIATGRGSDVLEQFPDVQRAWITWPPSLGWLHLAFAIAAQVLLAMLLVLLSAMRMTDTRYQHARDLRDQPNYWVWLGVAAAVPALGLVLWLTDTAAVSWRRVIAVPAVLGAVMVASLITHWVGRTGPPATGAASQVGEGAVAGNEAATARPATSSPSWP